MKFIIELIKAVISRVIFRKSKGQVIKKFCENMGIIYIKLAQILSTQNIGNIFKEEDRVILSSICDNVSPIPFKRIKEMIENEYGKNIYEIVESIEETPTGSASISQVHRAVLKNGDVVAIKVKRTDITKNIKEKYIKFMKKMIYIFGRFIGFKNLLAAKKVLDLYISWIYEEVDFNHELDNIKKYTEFANSVNGKVENTIKICVPKVYEELCTENIIVMEFITSKTINSLTLNEENKAKISSALNDYLQLSFYALFNGMPVIFHGDPHGGNIYI